MIERILANHGIEGRDIVRIAGSSGKEVFVVNGSLLVRTSASSMSGQMARFERIADLEMVPHIRHFGSVAGEETLNYLILDHLAGSDLEAAIGTMSDADQARIGAAVSRFLRSLHQKSSRSYDIGLYVPRISQFSGSWKEGHRQFWGLLRGDLEGLSLDRGTMETVERSFVRMSTIEDCLDDQTGPALLHNDFHPKNIIVADGALSGVIDWECSQFGEPDFDLVHLVHWTVFPPKEVDYRHITRAVLADQVKALSPARIIPRLTIYEIEHEICQLIWSQGRDSAQRDARLQYWLADGVDRLFSGLRVG